MVDAMTVRLETFMVRHQSDVERCDIGLYEDHPMAVGSDVRDGRVGWVTDILWIAVCYEGSDETDRSDDSSDSERSDSSSFLSPLSL
jgi:hypothetical protein